MKTRHSIKQAQNTRPATPKGLLAAIPRIKQTALPSAAARSRSGSDPLPALPACEGLDVWITPAQACKILGICDSAIYRLVDVDRPFLVVKRPLPRKILISLRSVRAFSEATKNPLFWQSKGLQEEFGAKLKEIAENKA